VKNYHIIEGSYVPYTEKKGNRIRIRSERFNETVFVSREKFESPADWCRKNGFKIVGTGFTKGNVILVSSTFKPLKDEKPKRKR
jgi:hypothetical protein